MGLVYTVFKIQSQSNYPKIQGEGIPVYDLQGHFTFPIYWKIVKTDTLQGHRPWMGLSELWSSYGELWTKDCEVFFEAWDALSPTLFIFILSRMKFRYPGNVDQG